MHTGRPAIAPEETQGVIPVVIPFYQVLHIQGNPSYDLPCYAPFAWPPAIPHSSVMPISPQ
jgi:hypothetical protein